MDFSLFGFQECLVANVCVFLSKKITHFASLLAWERMPSQMDLNYFLVSQNKWWEGCIPFLLFASRDYHVQNGSFYPFSFGKLRGLLAKIYIFGLFSLTQFWTYFSRGAWFLARSDLIFAASCICRSRSPFQLSFYYMAT